MIMRAATLALAATGTLAATSALTLTTPAPEPTAPDRLARSIQLDAPLCTCEVMPVGVSFLPGTPEHIMRRVTRAMYRQWLESHRDGGPLSHNWTTHWSGGGQGDGLTLAWSIIPDGTFMPNEFGEGSGGSNFEANLISIFGSLEAGKDRVRLVFDRWEELTGNTYVEVSDDGATFPNAPGPHNGGSNRGDIRIGMKNFNNAFSGVLAFNFFPDFGDMELNSDHAGNGGFFRNAFGNYRPLRNTMSHEHGHGIGMEHVCPQNGSKLLEPGLNTNFDGPQHDDRRGAQRGYGDRFEPNSIDDPGVLGSLTDGTTIVSDVSIDDNLDFDFYSFDVPGGKQVTLTATPVGFTYQDWDQNPFTGACENTGPTVNSLTIHDLELQLLDTDGQTVLAEANGNPAGQAETINDFVLPSGGTFFLRVIGELSVNDIQMYNINVEVSDAPNDIASLDSFEVIFGTHEAGGVNELNSSDNQYLQIQSQFGFTAFEPNLNEVRVLATSPVNIVSDLLITLESRVDQPGGKATIRLRNWDTNLLDTVAVYPVNTSDTTAQIDSLGSPDSYVRDSDGRIEILNKHVIIATFSLAGFESKHDWMEFQVVQ